ncbi:MAG TPA: 3-hydroxyacyl-CoA dehydrogenase NAD-binding domain-containing protein [Alphaproteobacteria bacterium]
MAESPIRYAVDGDGVATIAWDMPGRTMNVFAADSLAAFTEAVDRALADAAIKGVIVTSDKRDFIAGADLAMLERWTDAATTFEAVMETNRLLRRIETAKKPFVAALPGTALGAGLELALACHRRIAADNSRALFGLPEVLVGLMPGAGGTQRLPRMIGIRDALPLLLEGRKLPPQEALAAGMIDQVVPADALLAEARKWLLEAKDFGKPWDKRGFVPPGGQVESPKGYETFVAGNALLREKTWGNYPAPVAIMAAVYEGLHCGFDAAIRIEARRFARIVLGREAKAMIRTLFFSTQAADKLARRPKAVPASTLTKIGVLGAGMMGAGIAHASAVAGLEVVLIDVSDAAAQRGKASVAAVLDGAVERGRLSPAERDAALARIKPTTDYLDLLGAELVIEAVTEDRRIKAEVTRMAEAVIAEDAVFASNTSTLPITSLATTSKRPENFVGIHFFSPVHRMRLVEVIRGEATGDVAIARALDYVKRIRKTPIVVNDGRGFYTSRVFGTYVNEGLALLVEGVNPALIENAGRLAGMPVGPLAVADEVGIDLIHHIKEQTKRDLGARYEPLPGDDVVPLFVATLQRPGRKGSRGFYDYPAEGPKRLWPDLAKHFPRKASQPDVETVKRRLLHIQGVETARCLEEKIVADPRDADVGSVYGWGFPPFTGGTVSYIDGLGVADFVRDCEALAQQHGARFAPPALLRDMARRGARFYAK